MKRPNFQQKVSISQIKTFQVGLPKLGHCVDSNYTHRNMFLHFFKRLCQTFKISIPEFTVFKWCINFFRELISKQIKGKRQLKRAYNVGMSSCNKPFNYSFWYICRLVLPLQLLVYLLVLRTIIPKISKNSS